MDTKGLKSFNSMTTMDHQEETVKKNALPLVAVLGIGCISIVILSLIVFSVAFVVAGKFIFSPTGENIFKKFVENTLGIQLEKDINGDTFSMSKAKTGESIEVSEGKIPENFPKDFPLYPKAMPSGSAVGTEKMLGKGFWLVLESDDALTDVTAYYTAQLEAKGWTVEEFTSVADGSVYTVKKDKLAGTVIVSINTKEEKTTILITLEPTNEKNPAPQEVAPEGAEPVDESF